MNVLPGSLGDLYGDFVLDPKTETNALCSVIRLIPCVYLNKNNPAFPPKTTAETLLSQIDTENTLANHKRLLEFIRDKIWPRVKWKSQLPLSVTTLQHHVWRANLYLKQISNPHATPPDAEGTVLCEKCGFVSADGKPAFD